MEADGYVTVEVFNNGGGSWTEFEWISGPVNEHSFQLISCDIAGIFRRTPAFVSLVFLSSLTKRGVHYDNL
jgi:hypothetical protein